MRRLTGKTQGPIYFEGIRNYGDVERYKAALRALTPRELEDAYADENFGLSQVLHAKYGALQVAIILFGLGLLLAVVSALLALLPLR